MLGYQLSASCLGAPEGPQQARTRLLFTVGAAQVEESTFTVSITPGNTDTQKKS